MPMRSPAALALLALLLGCTGTSEPSLQDASLDSAMIGTTISSALARATSWHMRMRSRAGEMTIDVMCPDRIHTVNRTGNTTVEMIRIGQATYTRAGGKWTKLPAGGTQAPVCGGAPSAFGPGASSRVPTFGPDAEVRRGGTETVEGEACTVWDASSTDEKGVVRPFSICLGPDNLPRQIKSADAVATYSRWNQPITIEAPQM